MSLWDDTRKTYGDALALCRNSLNRLDKPDFQRKKLFHRQM